MDAMTPPVRSPAVEDLLAIERSRAYIHDDTVYYVRDEDIWAAFWHTPSIVNGPF